MKLKAIANVVTSKVGRQILTAQKHSPTLLFAAGVAGVVATVVVASRATLKLEEVLEEAEHDLKLAKTLEHVDYSEQDRQRDMVLIYVRTAGRVVRMYSPAIVLGALSIAALTGSHVILTRRNVAITAAYAALDRGFREYRQRVVDALGVGKDKEFRYGLADRELVEETEEGVVVKTVRDKAVHGTSVYARFFDENSTSWNKTHSYNQLFLQCQQNYANDLLRSRGHVFLNEVYDMLGIPRSKEGAVVGWVMGNGDDFVDFGVFEGDRHSGMRFVLGHERSILLDFNVDGIIYDKI
jgi:hypothetical protein